jgi:4-carboxymuconolactone decarboxylase
MDKERFERGDAIQREVMGDETLARSIFKDGDEFTAPLRELVTEFAWGSVWARPGLSRKTRSLINLAMLSALNRQRELGLHVQGALRNGATVEEIREVLLQVAVYCGFPAAVESFRVAIDAIRDAKQSSA